MCRLDYVEDERIDSMNITVYLGANEGNDYRLGEAVRELGDWIGTSGHVLVYGGSKSGLMGELAESVIEAGGEAIGVEPQFFIDAAVQYEKLTELIVTKNMEEMCIRDRWIRMPMTLIVEMMSNSFHAI